MFQCYYNEIIIFNDRKYIGKRIDTEHFETETDVYERIVGRTAHKKCKEIIRKIR